MSEPNFNKPSPVASTQGDEASPTSLLSHAASPVANASCPINNATATPTSPPRQAFFKGGSTGSFSRFPTPDKLALGFTPSPGQAANEVPTGLLLPPISPSGPILHEAGSLLRSTSSQTLQSESSSAGSLISSSSNSALSDILDVNPTAAPQPDIATTSRSRKTSASASGRRSGLSRSDIRESLLSFPSPPTSPRPGFSFAKAADTLLPASKAPDSLASSGKSLSAGPSRTRESTAEGYGTDELQASIDELLSAAGIGSLVRSPEQSSSLSPPVAPALRASSLPPTDAHPYLLTRSQPSLSLPPNMALPPLPPLSKLSLGQGGSPPPGTPSTEVQPAAIAPRNTLPLRSASQQSRQPAAGASPAAAEPLRREAPVTQPNAPVRTLRNAKSTESFLAAKSRQMAPAERFPLPKLGLHMTEMPEEPKQVRRRRTSLSIKIPKMFSKGKKHEEEVFPQSAMSQDGLQIPQSRFSPDSDAPVSDVVPFY